MGADGQAYLEQDIFDGPNKDGLHISLPFDMMSA